MDYGEPSSVDSPCIEWQGHRDKNGYGVKGVKGKNWKVHRLEWTKAYGDIPKGINICHKCDNPACYRLDHLFAGTQRQNVLDMFAKGRGNRRVGPNPAAGHVGENNCKAKLTWENVRMLREINKNTPVYGALCGYYKRLFGVSHDTIRSVVTNKTWRE